MRKPIKTRSEKKSKKSYRTPKLATHGDVAKLTKQSGTVAVIQIPSGILV